MSDPTCACGCGEAGPGLYRKGHNARLRGRLPFDHGSRRGYRQGCRCDECRAANTARERDRRRSHGVYPIPLRPVRVVRQVKPRPVTPESFLIDRMVPDEAGCWIWQKATNPGGYGVVVKADGSGATTMAHRRSYETFVGPIPDGLHIDHLCSVPSCINPAHLQPVTQAENNRRAGERRRLAS